VRADLLLLVARLAARSGDHAAAAQHAATAEAVSVAKGYRRGIDRAQAILAEVASAAG